MPAYTAYPGLRESLAPEFAGLADAHLDAIVAEVYGPDVSAQDVESFWQDLGHGFQNVARGAGHFAQQAAPVVQRALPNIVQGAASGASLGPWGMLAGAVAGGASGILSQSSDPTARSIGGAIGGVTQLAGGMTGGGALGNIAGMALGGRGGAGPRAPVGATGGAAQLAQSFAPQIAGAFGGGATGQLAASIAPQLAGLLGSGQGVSANALLGLLSRPETLQALSAAALGRFGRGQVPVGQHAVPVQSILGAVGTLAGASAHEAERVDEQHPAYFYGADGELAIDAADPAQRAAALLELFIATPPPWPAMETTEQAEVGEAEYSQQDAVYDEWLLDSEAERAFDQEMNSYV